MPEPLSYIKLIIHMTNVAHIVLVLNVAISYFAIIWAFRILWSQLYKHRFIVCTLLLF